MVKCSDLMIVTPSLHRLADYTMKTAAFSNPNETSTVKMPLLRLPTQ